MPLTKSKERPILFNGDMVRAILDGRKTQTRRPVKPEPWQVMPPKAHEPIWPYAFKYYKGSTTFGDLVKMKSPFGKPGDQLWVRETHGLKVRNDCVGGTGEFLVYRADNPDAMYYDYRPIHGPSGAFKKITWTPSIHMPKHACRLNLKVKRAWVERVQDISDTDAMAEGIESIRDNMPPYVYCGWMDYSSSDELPFDSDKPIHSFKSLWDSIYGTWSANPWVWCCEFEKMENK